MFSLRLFWEMFGNEVTLDNNSKNLPQLFEPQLRH